MINNTPNVVLKIYHYYPSYSDKEKQRKRDYYSSNLKDDFIGYISKGTNKDNINYISNEEKSSGLFNENGLMTKSDIANLRKDLRKTQSVIWDGLISFEETFGKKWCDSFEQAYALMITELPKFLKSQNFNLDNIVWFAGLHENTDNRHIHFCFYEKEPLRYSKKENKMKYSHGKLNKNKMSLFKANIETSASNIKSQIFKARQDLIKDFKGNINNNNKVLYNKFLTLANKLPTTGRVSYDSENMIFLKQDVDVLSEYILTRNSDTKIAFEEFLKTVKDKEKILKSYIKKNKVNYELENFNKTYVKDIYRRVGNIVIKHALKLRDEDRYFRSLKSKSQKQKHFKKKSVLDQILEALAISEKCNNEAIWAFKNHLYNLERMEWKIKQEQQSGYEM